MTSLRPFPSDRRRALETLLVVLAVMSTPCLAAGQWIENPANGHHYRLTEFRYWGIADEYSNDNQPDWFDAEAEAQSYHPDAHLVTVNDQPENDWLVATFGATERWIGYTDHQQVSTEGSWLWISGEPVTVTNWDIGQPDNGEGGEDCAHLNHGGTPGAWNDLGNVFLPWHPDLPLFGIVEMPEKPTPTKSLSWGAIRSLYR